MDQVGRTKAGKLGQMQTRQSGKDKVEMSQLMYCKINEGNGEQVSRWLGMVR